MKLANLISRILGILAVVLLIVSVVVCFWVQGNESVTQSVPRQAAAQAEQFMDALARGDLENVEKMLYGGSRLGASSPEGTLEKLVWDAYVSSFSYSWKSTCYPAGESVCQNVEITGLNIPETMDAVSWRVWELMNSQEPAEPEDDPEVRANGILRQAVCDVLEQGAKLRTNTITLTFVQNDGQWQAVPDASLRNAISGGLGG